MGPTTSGWVSSAWKIRSGPRASGPQQCRSAHDLHLRAGEVALQLVPVARADDAIVVHEDDDAARGTRERRIALAGRMLAQRDEDLHSGDRGDLAQPREGWLGLRKVRHGNDDRVARGHGAK